MNATTEINYDIDGSVMSVCKTVVLMEGVKVEMYSKPEASKPHEIVIYIGDSCVELKYSADLADMLGRLGEVSALELLSACQRNQFNTGVFA